MKQDIFALLLAVAAFPADPPSSAELYGKYEIEDTPFFYPTSSVFTPMLSDESISAESLVKRSDETGEAFGLNYLLRELKLDASELRVDKAYDSQNGISHVYATRVINGTPVANLNCAVHFKDGQVITWSASFGPEERVKRDSIVPTQEIISLEEAVASMAQKYDATFVQGTSKTVYIQTPNGNLVLAHEFQIQNLSQAIWLELSVDTATGKIVSLVSFIAKAYIKAVELPRMSVAEGFTLIAEPPVTRLNADASPLGWRNDGKQSYNYSRGNNVDAFLWKETMDNNDPSIKDPFNRDGLRVSLSSFSNVDYAPSRPANDTRNIITALNNGFYIVNLLHDIFYRYGFTEAAGNFQSNNFNRGGQGDDEVLLRIQDTASEDNAWFLTPPDGQNGIMNMMLWNTPTGEKRDATLDNTIMVHEFGHGVTARMTGGSPNGKCLGMPQSGGMGEGWSDLFALALTRNATSNRYESVPVGAYVSGEAKGIRSFLHSVDRNVNPLTWSDMQARSEPLQTESESPQYDYHAMGEIWSIALWEMYWNFVDVIGFTPEWQTGTSGNTIALQLVVAGLELQPCNPSFLQARDAILGADKALYNGRYQCLIWAAFAKRGMGLYASQNFVDSFDAPVQCRR